MEILTNGDGLSIGNGAQRTTRDVRQYNWNGLEITDVPGIGAFEGEDDEQIAFEAAKKADLILFLITDDAPQAAEAECFGRIMDLGKPVICIMNVKASAPEGKSIKLLTRDIEKRFDMERLNEIRKQFMSYSKQLGQDWGYVPFVYVHLKSAFMSQNTEDPQVKDTLHKVSRIGFLKKKIVEQVRERGCFYRVKTFIDNYYQSHACINGEFTQSESVEQCTRPNCIIQENASSPSGKMVSKQQGKTESDRC